MHILKGYKAIHQKLNFSFPELIGKFIFGFIVLFSQWKYYEDDNLRGKCFCIVKPLRNS